ITAWYSLDRSSLRRSIICSRLILISALIWSFILQVVAQYTSPRFSFHEKTGRRSLDSPLFAPAFGRRFETNGDHCAAALGRTDHPLHGTVHFGRCRHHSGLGPTGLAAGGHAST